MITTHPWKFALLLAAALWGIVLIINWLGPGQVQVSVEQVESLEKSDHIQRVSRYPDKLVVHLHEPLFVRVAEGDIYTDLVYVPRNAASFAFEQRSVEGRWASAELSAPTSQFGESVILLFIVFGIVFLGLQIRQDRRHGSVRRQIAELDAAYRAGTIEEAIYKEKLEDLLPQL